MRAVAKRRKDPAAVRLGRKGGLKAQGQGAKNYWAKLTPEERAARMARVREAKLRKRERPKK
jgi:hypothetical protein